MTDEKRARLEAAGWRIGTAAEFLGAGDVDWYLVEYVPGYGWIVEVDGEWVTMLDAPARVAAAFDARHGQSTSASPTPHRFVLEVTRPSPSSPPR